jgi:hypothetical protein
MASSYPVWGMLAIGSLAPANWEFRLGCLLAKLTNLINV